MDEIRTFEDAFRDGLASIYDTELQFLDARRSMLERAFDPALKRMIRDQMGQAEEQIGNLEQAFATLGRATNRIRCEAATGLVGALEAGMGRASGVSELIDCVIAQTLGKIEHHAVCTYRGLAAAAELMDEPSLAELLGRNLDQGEVALQKAETAINRLLRTAFHARDREHA
ncbi:DUF892 family protein [Isosphaeraceae bacterium EP7]